MTAPSMSWGAMLKQTQVKLELITDIDQYLMNESGLRGGTSIVSCRYAKANNPEVSDFDPSKPVTWI